MIIPKYDIKSDWNITLYNSIQYNCDEWAFYSIINGAYIHWNYNDTKLLDPIDPGKLASSRTFSLIETVLKSQDSISETILKLFIVTVIKTGTVHKLSIYYRTEIYQLLCKFKLMQYLQCIMDLFGLFCINSNELFSVLLDGNSQYDEIVLQLFVDTVIKRNTINICDKLLLAKALNLICKSGDIESLERIKKYLNNDVVNSSDIFDYPLAMIFGNNNDNIICGKFLFDNFDISKEHIIYSIENVITSQDLKKHKIDILLAYAVLLLGKDILNEPIGDNKHSFLYKCCEVNNIQMAQSLLNHGAIILNDKCLNPCPLHYCVHEYKMDLVNLLLPYCDSNILNYIDKGYNNDLLFMAYDHSFGRKDITEALLKNGALIRINDCPDVSVFHIACRVNKINDIRLFLKYINNDIITKHDIAGFNPMDYIIHNHNKTPTTNNDITREILESYHMKINYAAFLNALIWEKHGPFTNALCQYICDMKIGCISKHEYYNIFNNINTCISKDIIQIIIEFVYTNKIEISQEKLMELFVDKLLPLDNYTIFSCTKDMC